MLIVHVFIHVKKETIEAFKEATLENARNSVQEPGIIRFDVVQAQDDPAKFVLIEVYRTLEATARHKETAHYKKWKNSVENMMAQPRTSLKYSSIFPDSQYWEMQK